MVDPVSQVYETRMALNDHVYETDVRVFRMILWDEKKQFHHSDFIQFPNGDTKTRPFPWENSSKWSSGWDWLKTEGWEICWAGLEIFGNMKGPIEVYRLETSGHVNPRNSREFDQNHQGSEEMQSEIFIRNI